MTLLFSIVKEYFKLSNEIEEILKLSNLNEDILQGKVEMNSTKIQKGDIFFAINSGNNYIEEVIKKEPFLIIADKKNDSIKDKRVIFVEDTVTTMQELATLYREAANFKVIGITGSNGKTTTKDILFYILSEKYKVKKTEGNYNNHIGLPFTILTTPQECEALILEMGMSDLGEIDLLCKVAKPDFGIITNIGLSHMEHLKTKDNVFKAKTEMVKYLDRENLFIPSDDDYLSKIEGVFSGFNNHLKSYEGYKIVDFHEDITGMSFDVEFVERESREIKVESYKANLNGSYNALNATLTLGIAKRLGLTQKEIQNGLERVILTPMRFQKIEWEGIICINDAYNASPLSMVASLKAFNSIYGELYKIAALGDMLELGDEENQYHKETILNAIELGTEEIILFGPRMERALKELRDSNFLGLDKVQHFSDKKEINNKIKRVIAEKKNKKIALLLKGSRGMAMENIILI